MITIKLPNVQCTTGKQEVGDLLITMTKHSKEYIEDFNVDKSLQNYGLMFHFQPKGQVVSTYVKSFILLERELQGILDMSRDIIRDLGFLLIVSGTSLDILTMTGVSKASEDKNVVDDYTMRRVCFEDKDIRFQYAITKAYENINETTALAWFDVPTTEIIEIKPNGMRRYTV